MLESMAAPFVISPPERRELAKTANSRSARSEDGRRARIVLDLGRGLSLRAISGSERCSVKYRALVEGPFPRGSAGWTL